MPIPWPGESIVSREGKETPQNKIGEFLQEKSNLQAGKAKAIDIHYKSNSLYLYNSL